MSKGHQRLIFCDFRLEKPVSDTIEIDHRSQERFRGFQDTLGAAGMVEKAHIFSIGGKNDSTPEWLVNLERPVAIFAFNDGAALQLANHCKHLGYAVPDEVSIVGCDNDVVLCRLTEPELSSIDVNFRRLGYEAVRILAKGQPDEVDAGLKVFPAKHVVERASSRQLATKDLALKAAYGFISGNYANALDVNDITRASGVSRRTLESRFQKLFGLGVA